MCGGLWSIYYDKTQFMAIRHLCKTWQCGYCGKKRQKRLIGLAMRGEPDTFITLTVNPHYGKDPTDRARGLVNAWRRCVRQIRKQPKNAHFQYLAIVEATERGEPHLHVLCRSKWIEQRWLSSFMADQIGAPIVDVRRVTKASGMARYVAKYTAKRPKRYGKLKRYWHSQGWEVAKRALPSRPAWEAPVIITGVGDGAGWLAWAQKMGFKVEESGFDFVYASRSPP